MRRFLIVALFAAAAPPAAIAAPIAVHARFDDASVQFGDVIRAHVAVVIDPDAVRGGSVRVSADLGPLTALGPQRTAQTAGVVEVTRLATCATASCLGARGRATPKLPPVVVTATLRNGRNVRTTATWPALEVRGRVAGADLARARPPFRATLAPPAVTYGIAPSALEWLLIAAAILLAACAGALALAEAKRRRRRRPAPARGDELQRAIRLAREAESRPVPDRRRAAGLLARVLRERDAGLAAPASELAWSEPQPEAHALETLLGDVERTASS